MNAGPEAVSATKEAETGLASVPSTAGFHDTRVPAWRFWLLSLGVCLGLFLAMLDTSIVATSLFTIGVEFESLQKVNWVALAYTLAFLGCAVLFARLADIIGRRDAFIISYVIFVAFSLGCGFSQNLGQLIACRALQGLGGSGLYSITMIILPELTPDHLKKFIASLIGIVIAVAGVLGPVAGGVLTHYASWRWVFWINGPIGFVSVLLFFLTWPKAEYLPTIEKRSCRELDLVSTTLLIAASILFVFPFQNAGEENDVWNKAIFIAPLVVAVVCWVALVAWEYVAEKKWGDRLATAFPLRLLRNRVYAAATVNMILLGFPFLLVVYAFPLRLQVVNGKTSLTAGVMLLPMLGSVAVGSVAGGMLNGAKNRLFETLFIAAALMLLGSGLMTTLSGSQDLEPKALGFLVFIGLGFGLNASSSTILAATESSIRDHAPAQGILAQFRIFGGSIGIAASSAIIGVTLRSQLSGLFTPGQLESLHGPTVGLSEVQHQALRQAYSDAFTESMRVCTIICGAALLLTLGTYRRNPRSMEEQRKRQVEEEVDRRKALRAAAASLQSD